jgi:hypothetical protein
VGDVGWRLRMGAKWLSLQLLSLCMLSITQAPTLSEPEVPISRAVKQFAVTDMGSFGRPRQQPYGRPGVPSPGSHAAQVLTYLSLGSSSLRQTATRSEGRAASLKQGPWTTHHPHSL